MKKGLRNIEKQVLSMLELDSRTPFSRFRRSIGRSQQVVSYTVNSLMKKKILNGFYTLVDYSKLGVLNFRVYFRVSYINKEKFDKLIKFLVDEVHTSWLTTCGGSYDLICTFFTSNPSQFNKILKSIMEKFPQQLQNYTILTTIVNRQFGKKHLFKRRMPFNQVIIGGDREVEYVDDIDMMILDELSDDARKSSVAISNSLSLTSKSIIQRIHKLRERKIIKGFRPLLSHYNMGFISNLLLIKYHNISVELEDQLIKYLKLHPNINNAVKTLGQWDIEVEVETITSMDFRKIAMEIRQKFALLIKQIEGIPLYTTHKKNYFPRFLIEERHESQTNSPSTGAAK